MDKSANNDDNARKYSPARLLKAAGAVVAMLAGVAFLVGYILRPEFIVSLPKIEMGESEVTVRFNAENRTGAPVDWAVRVSILDREAKRTHGVRRYETLGEKEVTLSLPPGEPRPFVVTFPKPDRLPTVALVEPVGPAEKK